MKLTMLAALSIATAVTSLPLAATAQAGTEGPPDIMFKSPTGNIVCTLAVNLHGAASCEIRDHTWANPVSSYTGKACDLSFGGVEFILKPGLEAKASCYQGVSSLEFPGVETLDYGQTRTMDTVTCESEPTGITCTDSSTGHVLRLSSESYELG